LLLRLTRLTTSGSQLELRLAEAKQELITNAALDPGLSGFRAHRQANSLWSISITNDDKGGNPATTTAVHRTVM